MRTLTPAHGSLSHADPESRTRDRRSSIVDEETGEEAFRPYRLLALRVLARAVLDLASPAGLATDRESARAFLAGSGMLVHWCRVAALDPRTMVKHLEKRRRADARRQDAAERTPGAP